MSTLIKCRGKFPVASSMFGEYLGKENTWDFHVSFQTVLAHRRHTWDFMAAMLLYHSPDKKNMKAVELNELTGEGE